jgi:hypothetical protein
LRFVDALEDVMMPRFGFATYFRVPRNVMVVDARRLLADTAFIGRLALRALMLVAFGVGSHFDSSSLGIYARLYAG